MEDEMAQAIPGSSTCNIIVCKATRNRSSGSHCWPVEPWGSAWAACSYTGQGLTTGRNTSLGRTGSAPAAAASAPGADRGAGSLLLQANCVQELCPGLTEAAAGRRAALGFWIPAVVLGLWLQSKPFGNKAHDSWESAHCFLGDPERDPPSLMWSRPLEVSLRMVILLAPGLSYPGFSGKLHTVSMVLWAWSIETADHENGGLIVQHQRGYLSFCRDWCHASKPFWTE